MENFDLGRPAPHRASSQEAHSELRMTGLSWSTPRKSQRMGRQIDCEYSYHFKLRMARTKST